MGCASSQKTDSPNLLEFLAQIEETFTVFETDMHIGPQLLDVSKLNRFLKLDQIKQMEARIR